jgi:hypothetical protein
VVGPVVLTLAAAVLVVMATMAFVHAVVLLALVLLVLPRRIVGTVAGESRTGSANPNCQGGRSHRQRALQHHLSPLSDEFGQDVDGPRLAA